MDSGMEKSTSSATPTRSCSGNGDNDADGSVITHILKNALFVSLLYRRRNWFLYMEGGKQVTDPRSKSYRGMEIPNRPAGQRPQTAPPPQPNQFGSSGFGLIGLIPSLFNIQFHGFPDATVYGTTSGFPYGFNTFHGGHAHGIGIPQSTQGGQQNADNVLKNVLLLIGIFIILALICW
ncbi:E3 ubiquitin-protein ligase [Quillaja saponaria]|uniref:E3 ubiquitin-protein ligase n=1 Tax=Quillaja saponaria TaxID=32244 RepID=A0AAD7L7M0_QUISA|nr:E3 ubiquitin-protein ligase [Quillaja saponaria]